MLKNIIRNRVFILIILAVITIGMGTFIVQIRIDSSLTTVLPENNPVFQYTQEIEQQFGSTQEIIVLVSSDTSVYSVRALQAIRDITHVLQEIEEINADQVISISMLAQTLPGLQGFEIGPSMTAEEAEALGKAISNNPLFGGKLVGQNGKNTIISAPVSVDVSHSSSKLNQLVKKLHTRIAGIREQYPSLTIELSGHPIIQSEIMRYMANDLLKLFPLAIGVVMIILLIALRNLRGMFVPIIVTFVSIVWTFGLKGILGSPITIIETVIPVILISLGCANGIHIMSEFLHYTRRGEPPFLAVKRTMNQLTIPIVLTSVTTALGFSSLVFATGSSFRNMGLFLAFGVLIAMGFSLLFIPIILSYFRFPQKDSPDHYKKSFLRFRHLEHFAEKTLQLRFLMLALVVVMIGLSIGGIVQLQPNTNEVRYFKESTPIRQITEKIERSLGGISTLYIVLNADEAGRFQDPELLYSIEDIQKTLSSYESVSYTISHVDYVKMLFYTIRGGDSQYFTLPDNELFLKRLTSMLQKSEEAQSKMLSNYINEDYNTACVHVRLKSSDTQDIKTMLAKLKPYLGKQLPEGISYRFAGDYIRVETGENIVKSQIYSLFATLGTILIVLSLIFRSPILGGIIALPVSVAILFNFAIMWLFGIGLNPATAIITSVGLGVGVDYGIHYFYRFRSLYKGSGRYHQSLINAVVESGRGILFNAVAVGVGFLVLLFSSYRIIMEMGWIIALSMITTALLSITLIPVLLTLFKPPIPDKILLFNRIASGKRKVHQD